MSTAPAPTFDLRDIFAGQALVGMLPKGKEPGVLPMNPDQMAAKAYEYADAMLRARAIKK